jgi:membrane associated rhomboid family serine protease
MGEEDLLTNDQKRKKDNLTNTLESIFSPPKIEDPRDETFWDMLYINLFPNLKFFSFTIFFSFSLLIIFIIQIFLCGINMIGQFLEVHLTSITSLLLLNVENFQLGQFYRALTCSFIHASMPALGNSIIMLFIWISSIEHSFGIIRTFFIFCLTAFTANLFGLVFGDLDTILFGADGGIFGLLGAALGYIIFNWRRIDDTHNSRLSLFWMVSMIIMFSMLFSNSLVAVMTQLGGVLDGILVGLFFSPLVGKKSFFSYGNFKCHEYVCYFVGLIGHILFTVGMFLLNFRKRN